MVNISVKNGELMRKKRFLLVLSLILLLPLISLPVFGQAATIGCCVSNTGCSQTTTGSCTGGQTYYGVACTQINDCDVGCCCASTLNSQGVVVTTKKHCDGVSGQFFDLNKYTPTTATYVQGCNAVCGLPSSCSPGTKLKCSDGITVLAECTAQGTYGVIAGASCPAAAGAFVDTDGDGVPDSQDLCPNERLLTAPEETKETKCADNIDNDCDNVKDCNDPDCCSQSICYSSSTCIVITCGNNVKDAGEECDDGNKISGDGCSNICRNEYCGDNIVQPGLGEECDYGDMPYASWPNCYAPNEVNAALRCTLSGAAVPGMVYECNDGIDNDGDGCFDWPFDKGCTGENDLAEDSSPAAGCSMCGDNLLDMPNSNGFNEDCDSSDADCGGAPFPSGTCQNDCTCSYACLGSPGAPDSFEIAPVKGDFANELMWQMHPTQTCNLEKLYVYRCSSPSATCIPDQLIVVNQIAPDVFYYYKDKPITADTRYCYRIDAYYTTGAVASSEVKCITTGNEQCMKTQAEFCMGNSRFGCDDDNLKSPLENCSMLSVDPTDYTCLGPFADSTTKCFYQSDCNLCNGLFGLFAVEPRAFYKGFPLEGEEGPGHQYWCYDIPTCYNDTTRTTINKYQSCIGTSSCYDYTSESSCVENKCQIGECEWTKSKKAFEELGIGVCRPKEKEFQDCSKCGQFSRESQNILYGDCDVETCKLYGDCYYSYGKCGKEKETSCWSYMAEEDCIYANKTKPNQNASINTQWKDVTGGKNIVFVTSSAYTGDLGGLTGADTKCRIEAEAAGLPGTFKALLSDSTTDARDRFTLLEAPFTLVDGTVIADNPGDLILIDADNINYIKNPINLDANGNLLGPSRAWTGTDSDGRNNGLAACNGWTSSSNTDDGGYGFSSSKDAGWIASGSVRCNAISHLYCFEQNIPGTMPYTKNMKVGTDNRILKESNDYFEFGLCKWVQYTGNEEGIMIADAPPYICVKDADNSTKPDCDYGEENKACQTDNTAPITTFILNDHPIYRDIARVLLPQKIDLKYYTSEKATVYFCIGPETGSAEVSCYPKEKSMCGLQKTFEGNGGEYRLYYFAEDSSHNLEEVRYLPVHIDVAYPTITASADPASGGDGNDYGITLSSNEHVKCSGRLVKGNGVPTRSENLLEFEIDNSFTRNYYDLADDMYYFEYGCKDYAGNEVKDRVWLNGLDGVDTDRIHNLLPFGPQKENTRAISVETESSASCRYARFGGFVPGYDSMGQLDRSTDGKLHTKTLSAVSNEYYEYIVKCRFDDDGKIEGNDNDRIRFAIDRKGPVVNPVTTFEAFDFDVSKTWGKEQEIRLQCKDDYFERVRKVLNMDYGCRNISYKMNIYDGYTHSELDAEGITTSTILLTETGIHNIYYVADDTGNNSADDYITITIDNNPPELNIEVYPYPMGPGSKALDSISYGYYVVKVTSSKSLNDINMSLAAGNKDMPWSYMYNDNFGKTNYFMLRIPYPEEGGLTGGTSYTGTLTVTGLVKMPGSVCSLDKIDDTALVGAAGKTITINTQEPAIEIKPKPSDFEANGYPLRKVGGTYYTNESRLFITGERKNLAVDEVWLYVLNGDDIAVDMASPQKVYSYRAGKNADVNSLLSVPLSVAPLYAKKGMDSLYVANPNIYTAPGNYIQIKSKERVSYGHYREYYRIAWVENMGGGIGKVTLAQALENDLSSSDKIEVYTAPYPNNLFGEYIDLEPGNNTFYARPRSPSGIMPLPEDVFIIFTDPNPPVVISQTPNRGTTNNIHTQISIVVREGARESLVDKSSIKLTVNGEEIKNLTINEYVIGSFVYYELVYQPAAPLKDGTYLVVFSGHDNAGHEFAESSTGSPSWTFTIDTKAPSTPILRIENGTFYKGMWYVNRSPGFDLEFADQDNVTLTAIYKDQPFAGFNLGKNCSYIKDLTHTNLYRCVFEPGLKPWQIISNNQLFVDDEFQIIAEAYKTLANKQKSPKGLYYLDPLVIDNITPGITGVVAKKRVKIDGDVIIKTFIPNEFHDLNATLIFSQKEGISSIFGTTSYNLEQIDHMGSIYEFKWHTPSYDASGSSLPESNENYTLMIADYAGNYNTTNLSVTIDLKIPDIAGIHVSIMPTIEQLGEYLTKYTSVLVTGNFTDDDIAEIFIIPGSYVPSQAIYENVSQTADIYGKNFIVEMQINGTINETTLNRMSIFLVDQAGYQVFLPLNVVADLQPPRVERSSIT